MKTFASFGSIGVAVIGLCVGAGCPQLKDDDFSARSADNGGGATITAAGTSAAGAVLGGSGGGSSTCDAGHSGCAGGGREHASSLDAGAEPDAEPTGACGANAVSGPNEACYFVDSVESIWSEARASCQARGAGWDLAALRDAEDNAFVLSITGFEAWIGATDVLTEGLWSWVGEDSAFFEVGPDAGSLRFSNWSGGEPNNFDDSDCLRMLTTGLWADWPCGSVKGHVCQRITP